MPGLIIHGRALAMLPVRVAHHDMSVTMQQINVLILALLVPVLSYAQRIETVYLNENDSTRNMYVAVVPEHEQATALLVLLGDLSSRIFSLLRAGAGYLAMARVGLAPPFRRRTPYLPR